MKAFANVSIYDAETSELLHFERVYSNLGPECAVHENAAQLFKFFSEGQTVFSYVEAYCDDIFQQWKRMENDHTYTMTFTNENRPNWKLDN